MRRRTSPRFAALVLGVTTALAACGERARERPDVVLVLVDTLRADYLGCYGFEGDVSQRLDRLAREGVLFERCFTQAPWTKTAVASLLTSLHPEIHRVTTHEGWFGEDRTPPDPAARPAVQRTEVLPGEALTLAEALRAEGYETAAFVANPWIRADQGFSQGFETFEEIESKDGGELLERVVPWLRERTSPRPLFLYLHFMDVHGPYAASDADYEVLRESPSLGEPHAIEGREWRRIPGYLRQVPWFDSPSARERRTWRARYAAGVRAFDRHLGTLVDELARADRLDSTLLAVTSDHGEELMERDLWDHGDALFDAETHVPLVMRLPYRARAGERQAEVVSLIDLAPTILALAGLHPLSGRPSGWQGRDLSRLSAGTPDPEAFSVGTAVKWHPRLLALRTARHKLLCDLERGSLQVFDLERDPLERADLAPIEPELARALRAKLEAHMEELGAAQPLTPGEVEISSDLRARLEALGY